MLYERVARRYVHAVLAGWCMRGAVGTRQVRAWRRSCRVQDPQEVASGIFCAPLCIPTTHRTASCTLLSQGVHCAPSVRGSLQPKHSNRVRSSRERRILLPVASAEVCWPPHAIRNGSWAQHVWEAQRAHRAVVGPAHRASAATLSSPSLAPFRRIENSSAGQPTQRIRLCVLWRWRRLPVRAHCTEGGCPNAGGGGAARGTGSLCRTRLHKSPHGTGRV